MFNSSPLNSKAINGQAGNSFADWTQLLPIERQAIYLLDIGDLRLPISSAQATMRKTGQSFLQVVVPNGDQYINALDGLRGTVMELRSGYRYADDSLSPLEVIATAPYQLLARNQGAINDTLTLSGYGTLPTASSRLRELAGVQTRTIDADGKRRTRCEIDLLLRPGHLARDSDSVTFPVGVIQYFINAVSEAMEVMQDG